MLVVKINKFLYSKYSGMKTGNILIEEFLLESNLRAVGINKSWVCFYFDKRMEALEVNVKFMSHVYMKEIEVNFDREIKVEYTSEFDTPYLIHPRRKHETDIQSIY